MPKRDKKWQDVQRKVVADERTVEGTRALLVVRAPFVGNYGSVHTECRDAYP